MVSFLDRTTLALFKTVPRRAAHHHVHDIFFPHDYLADWLLNRRLALNEQLEAFE